jgi:hypothetical protein
MPSQKLNIKTRVDPIEPMYYTYGKEGINPSISALCMKEAGVVDSASAMDRWAGVGGGGTISVREGMTRHDYEFFRPSERFPRRQKEIIAACDESYRRVGLIRNILNAMSEFTCQGIQIFHPAASKQRRYRHWFRKVNGVERSERFANLLFRHGVVISKRWFADLNLGDINDLEQGTAAVKGLPDTEYNRSLQVYRNRIPMRYTFLNPTAVEIIGGDLAMFAGTPQYGLTLPRPLLNVIKQPKNAEDRQIVANLPPYIVAAVRNGSTRIPLDPEKVSVFNYKKDDWQQWPDPLIYGILTDIRMYDKLKLADTAALDGAISRIRLWLLGNLEYKIQPGPAAFRRLREQLLANTGGGAIDLIWDAAIDLKESSTDVYQFLGSAKYEPVLQAIYAGLGIPQSMTGQKEGGGMVNTAMGLRTLIERLQYARDILTEFWDRELYILQKAFGDRQPAQIKYDSISLSDEATEKKLWIDLCDRDIISVTTLQERWGQIPEVETMRLRTEHQLREQEKLPLKAGPYSPVGQEYQLRQAALQQGTISPTEAGVKKRPKAKGDKGLLDRQAEQQDKQLAAQKVADANKLAVQKRQARKAGTAKPKGEAGQGRPKGTKDTTKRKTRTPKATGNIVAAQMWARAAMKKISEVTTPLYVKRCKKTNMRGLTTAQAAEFENLKFNVLCNLLLNSDVSAEVITGIWEKNPKPNKRACECFADLIGVVSNPSVEDVRELQISAYAVYLLEGEADGEIDDQP